MVDRVLMARRVRKMSDMGSRVGGFHAGGRRPPGWGERFSLRCVRCTTERHDVIDALGDLSQREYHYPDDYRLAKDETPSRQAMRLDLLGQIHRRRRK
jgi:hypothetical protein